MSYEGLYTLDEECLPLKLFGLVDVSQLYGKDMIPMNSITITSIFVQKTMGQHAVNRKKVYCNGIIPCSFYSILQLKWALSYDSIGCILMCPLNLLHIIHRHVHIHQ